MSPPTDLKGRPIVAGPVSPTQRLSEFIDTLIKPIVLHLNTYIKDDWDFLRKIPYEFSNTVSLYSYDITSLYTSIPHSLGLEALTYCIEKRRDLTPIRFSNDFIIESAKFVLENNNFLFDNEYQETSSQTTENQQNTSQAQTSNQAPSSRSANPTTYTPVRRQRQDFLSTRPRFQHHHSQQHHQGSVNPKNFNSPFPRPPPLIPLNSSTFRPTSWHNVMSPY